MQVNCKKIADAKITDKSAAIATLLKNTIRVKKQFLEALLGQKDSCHPGRNLFSDTQKSRRDLACSISTMPTTQACVVNYS